VIFTPVEHEGDLLVDGGVVNNLPVDVARDAGADRVIAVELVHAFPHEPPDDMAELGFLSFSIMLKYSMKHHAEDADVLIAPDLRGYSSMDLSPHEELIRLGTEATRAQLQGIRDLL